jgi:hypothetical protein
MPFRSAPPLLTEDERFSYDPDMDLFVLKESSLASGTSHVDHPLSVTLASAEPGGIPTTEEPSWDSIIRKLAAWGVRRIHLAEAETVSREDLQAVRDAAFRSGLSLILSIEDDPAAPNLDLPKGSRLHAPVSPDASPERLDFLGRHAAAEVRVRALTFIDPRQPEFLLDLGSELAVRDIQEWTISPPLSSADAHWLSDPINAKPAFIEQLQERFPWIQIEHASFSVRESSLIALSDGALFTTDPITADRTFLGWLADMRLADVLKKPAFDFDLHLRSWLRTVPEAHDEATLLQEAAKPIQSFDAFASYDSEDWPEVQAIALRLKEVGIRTWVDKWELRPGDDWLKVLEAAMGETSVMLVFIGQKGELVSPYHEWEPRLFLQEMKTRNLRLIPVILKSAPRRVNLPLTLKSHHHVDFREDDPDSFERLVWGITGKKPR